MDGPRPLRTNCSTAVGSENFRARRELATDAREIATATTYFRASGTRICANRVENALLSRSLLISRFAWGESTFCCRTWPPAMTETGPAAEWQVCSEPMHIAAVGERTHAEINLFGNDRLVGRRVPNTRNGVILGDNGRAGGSADGFCCHPNANVCSRAIDSRPREQSRRQAAPPWMRNQRLAPIPGKQKRGQARSLPPSLSLAVPD